jgi:hypothetical protein
MDLAGKMANAYAEKARQNHVKLEPTDLQMGEKNHNPRPHD